MAQKQPRRAKHIPQRSCVVCRQKLEKRRLTRIVRTPDEGVVVDRSGKRNGRGAYLCDQPKCWDKIQADARILNQALMVEITAAELAVIITGKPTTDEVA